VIELEPSICPWIQPAAGSVFHDHHGPGQNCHGEGSNRQARMVPSDGERFMSWLMSWLMS
jgi:hypothetical protein